MRDLSDCPKCQRHRLCRPHSIQWVKDFVRCQAEGPCAQSLPRNFCKVHMQSLGGLTLRFTEWPPWSIGHAWYLIGSAVLNVAGFAVCLAITLPLYAIEQYRERGGRTRARWFHVVRPVTYRATHNATPGYLTATIPAGQRVSEVYLTLAVGMDGVRALWESGAIVRTGRVHYAKPWRNWTMPYSWPDCDAETYEAHWARHQRWA